MSDVKETVPQVSLSVEEATAFLTVCAQYFESRPTGGEDAAHWANVSNARMCRKIIPMLAAAPSPAEALPSQTSGAKAVTWTPTKERRNHLKEPIGIIEYRVLGTPYKVVQNYQLGGSWTSYRGSHCLADCVSLDAAKATALKEISAIATALAKPASEPAGGGVREAEITPNE